MTILNKDQAKRKVKASTSLHYENETEKAVDESGQTLKNNLEDYMLIDPEDYDAAGSTHFPNEDAAHPVLAGKKVKRAVKAAELECPDDGGSTVDDTTTNVGTIPNDVDPDSGYIGAADMEDIDPDEDDDVDFGAEDPDSSEGEADPDQATGEDPDDGTTEASVSGDELVNNQQSSPELETAAEEDDADWDAPPADDDSDVEDLAEEDEESGEGGVAIEDVTDEPEDVKASDEDLSILDIDETPDDQVDDVMFAAAGTRLMALKANRVIATMTARMAVNSGRNDIYLSDQFQEVVAMQLQDKGLRRGLKSMGFALATVNVGKQSVLKAQVQKEVHKTTAAMRKVQAGNQQAFNQSLAIAAVGINRNMFKGVNNELRAALEGELRRYGVQGAKRIVATVFAEHGPSYAKQVIELANKISAMPEQVRDSYVDALDMNAETMDEPDEDVVPIGADMEDDIEDEFGEEIGARAITASAFHAGTPVQASRKQTQVSAAASGKFSVLANQMLNGSKPMF